MQTHLFACLSDNYGVLVHDPESGETASIDVPEEAAVRKALADTGWTLTHILITHHHNDHIGGLEGLKAPGITVIGPRKDAGASPASTCWWAKATPLPSAGRGCRCWRRRVIPAGT